MGRLYSGKVECQLTLKEVAQDLGISSERVRQLEERALSKCLLFCQQQNLQLEDLLLDHDAPTDFPPSDVFTRPGPIPDIGSLTGRTVRIFTLPQRNTKEVTPASTAGCDSSHETPKVVPSLVKSPKEKLGFLFRIFTAIACTDVKLVSVVTDESAVIVVGVIPATLTEGIGSD